MIIHMIMQNKGDIENLFRKRTRTQMEMDDEKEEIDNPARMTKRRKIMISV